MTPLEAEIRRIIALEGPMSMSDYMWLCLGHPKYGYYVTRDPFGPLGDFTTAPEISQMFGELIGLWASTVWQQMGSPTRINLIELGPGRGTLMADVLRAAKSIPDFHAALSVHLVEVSGVLADKQRETLARSSAPIVWHHHLHEPPAGPAIVLANEFFDALPVSHYVRADDGWHERVVGIGEDDRFTLALNPVPVKTIEGASPMLTGDAPIGAMIEHRSAAYAVEIARHVKHFGGAALIIDYGHPESHLGETLQGVREHRYADPLSDPGNVDLTAHVDFAELARAARLSGPRVDGPITQGAFLRRLGIEARAARLKASATVQQAADIDAAVARLTAPDQMGDLFKVLAFAHPALGPLPGFDT